MARPTYAEEFQNIRENVHKVVLSTLAEDYMSEKTKNEYRQGKSSSEMFTVTERGSPNYKPISTVRFDI